MESPGAKEPSPRPVNTPPPVAARAMGMKKRRVEPLSPQSSRGRSAPVRRPPVPVISSTPGAVSRQRPPRAVRHRRVASTSWLMATPRTVLIPFDRTAAIASRWAWDLLGGGVTVPESFFGVI